MGRRPKKDSDPLNSPSSELSPSVAVVEQTNGHQPEDVKNIPSQADPYVQQMRHDRNLAAPLLEMPGDDSNWMTRTKLDEEEILGYVGMIAEDMAIDEGYTDWAVVLHHHASLKVSQEGYGREQYVKVATAEMRARRFARGMLNRFRSHGQVADMADAGGE